MAAAMHRVRGVIARGKGALDLDAFVSERIGLSDVEAAFDKMGRGEVLRSVVVF